MLCKHCNCNSKLVCSTCGAVVDEAELILEQLEQIRPFDLAYYQTIDKKIIYIDHAVVDRILPRIRSSSGKVLMFFIASTKGGENIAFEEGFTYAQLMKGTGIKSTGTMHLALAELGDGLPATKRRKAIKGWNLIVHVNDKDKKKSKFVYGNRWRLNTDRVLDGVAHKLFNAGEHGTFFMMSPWIVLNLFPTLTGDQAMILTFIHRMTIGWSKEENSMTYNFFTGWRRPSKDDEAGVQFEFFEEEQQENYTQSAMSSRKGVKNVLGQLVALNLVIKKEAKDPRYGHIYSLNKELLVTLELRAEYPQPSDICLQPSDIYPQPSDVSPQPSDIYPQATRHVPPLNNDLKTTFLNENDVNKKNETIPPNPSVNDTSVTIDSVTLCENGEGIKNTLSEGVPAKRSRDDRDKILRNVLGMEISATIKNVLNMIEEGKTTDEQLDYAILHKQTDDSIEPKYGPGIYANFLTKKLVDGEPCQLIWKNTPQVANQSDAAPKSPPPTNVHGAAPPPSPTPPYTNGNAPPNYYTNGHDRAAEPTVAAEYLEVWKEVKERLHMATTAATFNSVYQKAMLKNVYIRMDVNQETIVFVIGASSSSVDWMKNRAYTSMLRTLTSVTGNKQMDFEFISNEKEKV